MGKGNFRPRTESTSLNRLPKHLSQVITRRPLRLCQIRWISVRGGLLGIWVKYNQNYFYLCPFFGNSPTGQTPRRIFTHDGSNDTDSRKDVPFSGIFHIAPHLGGYKPQKPQFWGVNRRFQAKLAKSKNVHIIKTTASIPTKFCTGIKTTKCPSWVVPHTHYKSKMADGRHLGKIEKLLYLSQGSSNFDEIWHGDAVWPSGPPRPLKIKNFKNTRWRRPPFWKI